MDTDKLQKRFFISYTGVTLPLTLVNELDDGVEQRITYFIGYYTDQQQLLCVEKVVYGEIEMRHEYDYDAQGKLSRADIIEDDETRSLVFDEHGQPSEV